MDVCVPESFRNTLLSVPSSQRVAAWGCVPNPKERLPGLWVSVPDNVQKLLRAEDCKCVPCVTSTGKIVLQPVEKAIFASEEFQVCRPFCLHSLVLLYLAPLLMLTSRACAQRVLNAVAEGGQWKDVHYS